MTDVKNTTNSLTELEQRVLFSFGVVADVQYADIEDRQNFEKSAWRYYRKSISILKDAVQIWNNSNCSINFILQLGDIIDGFNTLSNSSEESLKAVLKTLSQFKGTGGVHHTWGNHEFYNFNRETLLQSPLNSNPSHCHQHAYYDFSPHEGFRIVVLDTYDVALLGYREDAPEYQDARKRIIAHNKNPDLNSPDGLYGINRRFSKVNGAMSERQLAWLDEVLTIAEEQRENVIIMGHIPVYEPSTYAFCMLWNFEEVLKIFHGHPCVVAYLAGHDHTGGYAVDDHGVHHITVRGIVEAVGDENPAITVHVYQTRLEFLNLGPRYKPIDKLVIDLKH